MGKIFQAKKIVYKKSHTPTSGFKSTNVHLEPGHLKGLLEQTYKKGKSDYGDYKIDKDLSTARSKVYYNSTSGKTVVAHRGTVNAQDWKENAMYALGMNKKGKGFKKSEKVQKAAEAKYGTQNLETIGHSKGGIHAERLGQKGLVQTLNKPVSIKDIKKVIPLSQNDFKTSRDPVSILREFQKGHKAIVVKSKTFNPLKEHRVFNLGRLSK